MKEIVKEKTIEEIRNKICNIRGVEVLMDSDLASIYGVETKRVNEAVRRNPKKFPKEFCFELNEYEKNELLRSQIATSKKETRGGRQYLPFVFTEQA